VTRRNGVILAAQAVVLLTALLLAALGSEAADWRPLELVALLVALAVGSDVLAMQVRNMRISGAFLAVVLAMVLLGPAPAVAVSLVSTLIDAVVARRSWDKTLNNFVTWTTFPVVGALMFDASGAADEGWLWYCGAVLIVFMTTNSLNFAMVALYDRVKYGVRLGDAVRKVHLPLVPSEFGTGLLTAAVAYSYHRLGVGAVALAAVVLFVFQYLIRLAVQAHERGEELGQRSRELASLQVGLLSTVLQTLSMRDAMTARHSAAVARYAREVARMLGLPEREQDLIHTAALLHDIGKFIFPDSILFADRKLTDEEWEIVKLHPEQGAKLVRRIEGYGPVAEIIHSHHERVDGRGYPANLAGEDIPIGSRIIAAADTYDVMTSRDSYRRPVSSEAAIAELRRVAGSQLDPLVVETFIEMIESGRVAFRHADQADFERELAFERRVEDYARPRVAAA
jgi:putative nucleotidyltransferase with HDIG domain